MADDKNKIPVTPVSELVIAAKGDLKKAIAAELASSITDDDKRRVEVEKRVGTVATSLTAVLTESYKNGGDSIGLEEQQAIDIAKLVYEAQKANQVGQGSTWQGKFDGDIPVSGTAKDAIKHTKEIISGTAKTRLASALAKMDTDVTGSGTTKIDAAAKTALEGYSNSEIARAGADDSAVIKIAAKYIAAANAQATEVGKFASSATAEMQTDAKAIADEIILANEKRAKLAARQKTFDEATNKDATIQAQLKTDWDALKKDEEKIKLLYKRAVEDVAEVKDASGTVTTAASTAKFKNRTGNDASGNPYPATAAKLKEAFDYTLHAALDEVKKDNTFKGNWNDGGKDGAGNYGVPTEMFNKNRFEKYGKLDMSQVKGVSETLGSAAGKGGKSGGGSDDKGEGMSERNVRIAGGVAAVAGLATAFGARKTDEKTGEKKWGFMSVVGVVLGAVGLIALAKPELVQGMIGGKGGRGV